MTIRAITIDLDETLWPVGPAIAHAESSMQRWLEAHAPRVASEYPPSTMRAMREEIHATLAGALRNDIGHVRRLALERALVATGDDPAKAHRAYEVFDDARQQVELFPDALPAIMAFAARYPLVALSNGTADVERVGIGAHFAFSLSPRTAGIGKPHPRIFHLACERLGVVPHEVLHIGDDAVLDVEGALGAGLKAAWLNRPGTEWIGPGAPDLIVSSLAEIVDWLDAHR